MRNGWMRMVLLAVLLPALPLMAGVRGGNDLSVVVDGRPLPQYSHRGTTYIEAVREREYSLRITNPTPYRVAVALSVDGLNTIDAKHTEAFRAAKWVLEPYESAEISGWQVNDRTARRFFFTGERSSYGAALGETENLGVIEAVFFRERRREVTGYQRDRSMEVPIPSGASAPSAKAGREQTSDDYAATGMGDRTQHGVERVQIELERQPIASARIRYEFRPQLVRLGVLPAKGNPLQRREKARGFDYCPEPN